MKRPNSSAGTLTTYMLPKFNLAFLNGYMLAYIPIIDREPLTITDYHRYDFLSLPGFAGKSDCSASGVNPKGPVTGTVLAIFGSTDTIRMCIITTTKGACIIR